jgi:raffinose/stachyose/melibiose transport system permease protein
MSASHVFVPASSSNSERVTTRGATRRKNLVRPSSYLWLLAPAVLVYIAFVIYPFLSSIRYSFYNWSGVGPLSDFIGFANYAYIFDPQGFLPYVGRALLHNLYFFVLSFFMSAVFGLLLAVLLYNVNERASRFFQALYFIPYVIPPIVVGYMFSIYLEPGFGLFSTLAYKLNLPFLNTPFLGDPSLALPTVAGIAAWAGMGFPVLVFLAALIGIPHDLLDAARIDGASGFASFWHVVFPMLRSTFVTVVTLTWIGSFSVFDLVYVLEGTQAGPNYATDVLGTLFYRTAWGGFGATAQGMGLAAAVAVVGFVFVMAISAIFVWLQRRLAVEV